MALFLNEQIRRSSRPRPAWVCVTCSLLVLFPWRGAAQGQTPAGTANLVQAPSAVLTNADAVEIQPSPNESQPPAPLAELGSDWVRIARDGDDVVGMETAIVRYVPIAVTAAATAQQDSPRAYVDLIGAIHVGDKTYYAELNRRFAAYDALLYELVAPDGTVVPLGRGTSNAHPLGALQNGMKNMLELEHQLEQIDYTKQNFVHADMSPDEFVESMRSRREGFIQMYFRLVGQSIGQQSRLAAEGESLDFHLLSALFARDRARQLKLALAGQLDQMESLFLGFGGEAGSTLITERNKVALEVLRQQLSAGKKRLGIFYGAGHLADMDQRLRTDFDMVPVSVTWLRAWDLAE